MMTLCKDTTLQLGTLFLYNTSKLLDALICSVLLCGIPRIFHGTFGFM